MPSPRTVKLGQSVELADGNYTIVDARSGVFRLRSELTGEYRIIGHIDLARLLPPGVSVETTSPPRPELTVAESLNKLSNQARVLLPHLEELLSGRPAVGTEPRSEYSLSLPMTHRLQTKLKELRTIGIQFEIATLKRRLYRYRDHGAAGLVDRRTTKAEAPLIRMDKGVKTTLIEILDEYQNKSTPTVSAIRALLRRRLAEHYPDAKDRPVTPSKSSVERYVKLLDGDRKTTGSARQRRSKGNSPDQVFSSRLASAPGDEAQIDGTQLDAFVRMPDGSVGRPWLVLLVDKHTKSILGHNLTSGPPIGVDHAVLLARALVPQKIRPWSTRYKTMKLPEMPWSQFLDPDQREVYDTHRPFIFPRRIITDNGRDFTSEPFGSACSRYGIHLTEAPIVDPTSKAQVERMFGTIRTKFTQFLPGYTGGRLEFRGKEPENEELLDLRTVNDLLERWISIVWQNRKHDGLVDPYIPSLRHTPNTMYAASLELSGHFFLALEEEDFIALMPSKKRIISAQGIEFGGRRYDSSQLRPMRDQRNAEGKKILHDIYYDPSDIHQVWVRSTFTAEWIVCEWNELDGLSRPHRAALMAKAHQLALRNGGFTDDEADELMLDLLDDAVADSRARDEASTAAAANLLSADIVLPLYGTRPNDEDDDPDEFTVLAAL